MSDHSRIGRHVLVLVEANRIALKVELIDLDECKTAIWAVNHDEAWVEVEIFPIDVAEAQRLPAAVDERRLREVQTDRLPLDALPRDCSSAHPVLDGCTPGYVPDLRRAPHPLISPLKPPKLANDDVVDSEVEFEPCDCQHFLEFSARRLGGDAFALGRAGQREGQEAQEEQATENLQLFEPGDLGPKLGDLSFKIAPSIGDLVDEIAQGLKPRAC